MASKSLNKYRIWCITEQSFVYIWDDILPTKCPNNESHEIDIEQIGTVDRLSKNDVSVSDIRDELDRPFVRTDSRDDHDTTYFTTKGDTWTSVSGYVLQEPIATSSSSSGTETNFTLPHKEVRNVVVRVDGIEVDDFSIDYTELDSIGNKAESYCRGVITPTGNPWPGGVLIDCDYDYAEIGSDSDNEMKFDFTVEDSPKSITLGYCDPIHIKDGVVFYDGGEVDSTLNVYIICPAGNYYKDNNGNYAYAFTDITIAYYVVDQMLLGSAPMGIYFDVEARSTAIPNNYKVKIVIDKGSSTTLKGCVRLEINRQRTTIL